MKGNCIARSTWLILLLVASHSVSLIYGLPTNGTPQLDEYFSWHDLRWDNHNVGIVDDTIDIDSGKANNALPGGFAIWRDKIFVTVPRITAGVPATLNYVWYDNSDDMAPKLIPYPSLAYNQYSPCGTGIISAYGIEVDECDRLWVIDSGWVLMPGGRRSVCPPKLIVFDLRTNEVIRHHNLPYGFINQHSIIGSIAVEADSRSCDNAFATISGIRADALMAYEWMADSSWVAPIKEYYPREHEKNGYIYGMTLAPSKTTGEMTLLFHPLNSNAQWNVPTKVLKNKTAFFGPRTGVTYLNEYMEFVRFYSVYSSSMTYAWDTIFYTDNFNNAIRCWSSAFNETSKDESYGIVVKNDMTLRFPNVVKIYDDKLWILSNRLPEFLESGLVSSEVNFRLSTLSLSEENLRRICSSAA